MSRQTESGGFNGRPEKLPDVCYSWWALSTAKIIKKENWINFDKLKKFILESQDFDDGGIADRKGNVTDIFHTYFGICGLSLMNYFTDNIKQINEV